jgi:hypothetical protein
MRLKGAELTGREEFQVPDEWKEVLCQVQVFGRLTDRPAFASSAQGSRTMIPIPQIGHRPNCHGGDWPCYG